MFSFIAHNCHECFRGATIMRLKTEHLAIKQQQCTKSVPCRTTLVTSDALRIEAHLAGGDVESAGAQVHSLPLVNEGQHQNNAGALWRTNSTQTKHYDPLVCRNSLRTRRITAGVFCSL